MSVRKTPKEGHRGKQERHMIDSDGHNFVGRLGSLGIVVYSFDSYEELARYPDCKYAYDVNDWMATLVRRIESLNMIGDMLWLDQKIIDKFDFPVSRHDWLNVVTDVFLMRVSSIIDCSLILASEVYELGLSPKDCVWPKVKKANLPADVLESLSKISRIRDDFRDERNERFHWGYEREFSSDDVTFKTVAMFEKWGQKMGGTDKYDREIDVRQYFVEGLEQLQIDFNQSTRSLMKALDNFYDVLAVEFEARFSPRFNDPKTGFGALQRRQLEKSSS